MHNLLMQIPNEVRVPLLIGSFLIGLMSTIMLLFASGCAAADIGTRPAGQTPSEAFSCSVVRKPLIILTWIAAVSWLMVFFLDKH